MITNNNEVIYLRHLVNTNQIKLKDIYYLIISTKLKSVNNRRSKQSRFLHDNNYDVNLNGLCHEYMSIEYPEG